MRHPHTLRGSWQIAVGSCRSAARAWLFACASAAIALSAAAGSAQAQGLAANTAKAPAVAQSPLDQILREISTYNGGIESASFWKLRDYVQAHMGDAAARSECETKLVAFLKTPATPSAKMAASRHLRLMASERAVPGLQALLTDERTADYAIFVLQQIPGAAADKALLQTLALPKVGLDTRIAIIAALGQRGTADAVTAIAPLMKQPATARSAITALGAIGTDAAVQALTGAYPGVTRDLKPVAAGALMRCAEKARAAKNEAAALRLYEVVAADASTPVASRRGAAIGRIATSGANAQNVLMAYLQGSDVAMQEAAIAALRDTVRPEGIGAVCVLLRRLPEASQVKTLAVLAGYPKDAVLPAILNAAQSDSATVRIAALKAIATTGDASVVPVLAQTAAKSRGAEQTMARTTLGMVKGASVDAAVLKMMADKPSEDIQAELILAVAERRIFAAKPAVAAALGSSSSKVRAQALRALRTLGTPSDMSAVLDLIVATRDDTERSEAEGTAVALAQKTASQDGRASVVRSRLNDEKDVQARVRLVGVLGLIGDNSTLPLLRRELESANAEEFDAAVRALAAWPNTAAREDLLRLARDCRNETHRLLAIRGLVRLVRMDRYRDRPAAVADLRQAAGFAWRPEEQKLVLGAVVDFPCDEALALATSYLREDAVKQEAQAAVDKIKERLAAQRKIT